VNASTECHEKKVAAIISFAPLVGTIAGSQLQSPKKSLPLRPVQWQSATLF